MKRLVSDLLSSLNQVQTLGHRRVAQLLQLAAGLPASPCNLGHPPQVSTSLQAMAGGWQAMTWSCKDREGHFRVYFTC